MLGVLFGLVGITKPRAASIVGLVGNLLVLTFTLLSMVTDRVL